MVPAMIRLGAGSLQFISAAITGGMYLSKAFGATAEDPQEVLESFDLPEDEDDKWQDTTESQLDSYVKNLVKCSELMRKVYDRHSWMYSDKGYYSKATWPETYMSGENFIQSFMILLNHYLKYVEEYYEHGIRSVDAIPVSYTHLTLPTIA